MKKASLVDKDRILYIPRECSGSNLCVQGRSWKTRNVLNLSSFSGGFSEGLFVPANLPSHVLIAINTTLPSVMWCKETATIVSTFALGFVLYLAQSVVLSGNLGLKHAVSSGPRESCAQVQANLGAHGVCLGWVFAEQTPKLHKCDSTHTNAKMHFSTSLFTFTTGWFMRSWRSQISGCPWSMSGASWDQC